MQAALAALALPPDHLALLGLICFIAGLVRGFSGFALSAMVMASGALILPPVQLIPVCWWLEMTASLFMLRGGWREANRKVALGLAIGSTIGVPFGLALTTQVDVETSKLIALAVIASLAALQLARVQLRFLASNWGLYGSGWMAGVATGLASVGGMVVALYVLAQNAPPREMRASLVLFLFLGSVTTALSLLAFGLMDRTAIARGLAMAGPAALGVILGQLSFSTQVGASLQAVLPSAFAGSGRLGHPADDLWNLTPPTRRALSNAGFTGRIEQTGRGSDQGSAPPCRPSVERISPRSSTTIFSPEAPLQIGVGDATKAFGHLDAMGGALGIKGQMLRT